MNRTWVGIVIFAVLLAFGIGTVYLLDSLTSETVALLEQAAKAAEAEALPIAELARARWLQSAGFIDTVMSHEETDEIHREFSGLLVYARQGNRDEYLASCGRLLVMVRHLTEMERPLLRNIL